MEQALRDKWTKLYDNAINIARLKPWKWIIEEKLIIINAYEGLDFYLSVMGRSGMFEGIMLCTSKKAICNYGEMQSSPIPDLFGINYQEGILLVFNKENFSLPENLEIANEFMPRKIDDKIITFESFVKGYMPSKLTEEELDDAIIAYETLNKALIMFDKAEKNECDAQYQSKLLKLKNDFVNEDDKCMILNYDEEEDNLDINVDVEPDIIDYSKSLDFPDDVTKELKEIKHNNHVYQIEVLNNLPIPINEVKYKNPCMNESIKKTQILRYFILTDETDKKVLKFTPYEKPIMSNQDDHEFIDACMNDFANLLVQNGIPNEIIVRDEETQILLENIAKELDINLTVSPYMDIVDDFLYGFFEHITGESVEDFEIAAEDEFYNDDDDNDDDYFDDEDDDE